VRVLVTGGAGFIGSHLVRTLLAGGYPAFAGAEVLVLDLLTYAGTRTNLPVDPRLTFVHGDIRDPVMVGAVMPGTDVVVHFAAESHVDRSISGAADFVSTNVVGTQVLLQAALDARVSHFVHVSTDEVYGSIDEGSWPETHPLEPNSPYSASKAGSDLLARSYHRTFGLPVCITRCSNNYGPHQFPEKVIPLFVTNLLDGHKVPLYGDGLNVRDWLHVMDHCRALDLLIHDGTNGEVYNIGGGNEVTNLELTHSILRHSGKTEALIKPVADRKGHDRRYSLGTAKLRGMGWRPQVDFAEGLRETVAWYRENEWWWRPIKERDPQFKAYYETQYGRRG